MKATVEFTAIALAVEENLDYGGFLMNHLGQTSEVVPLEAEGTVEAAKSALEAVLNRERAAGEQVDFLVMFRKNNQYAGGYQVLSFWI